MSSVRVKKGKRKRIKDEVEVQELLSESICRLCHAICTNDELTDIFLIDGKTQLSIKIMACTSLEVTPNDPLPKQICSSCNDFLGLFYAFRKKCKSSDTKFRRFLRMESAGKANCISELSDDEDDEEYDVALTIFNDKQDIMLQERLKEATKDIVKQYEDEKRTVMYDEKLRIYREEKQKIQENAMRQIISTLKQRDKDTEVEVMGKETVYTVSKKLPNPKDPLEQDNVNIKVIFEVDNEKDDAVSSQSEEDYMLDIVPGGESDDEVEKQEEYKEIVAHEAFEEKNIANSKGDANEDVAYLEEEKNESVEIVPEPDDDTVESNDQESQHDSILPGSPSSVHNMEIETEEGKIYFFEVEEKEKAAKYYDEKGKLFIFKCSRCPKTFPREKGLKNHEKSHMKKKGYSCTFCEKWFPSNSSRVRHERIHTGEKPFSCDICGRSFVQKEILKRHVVVHSGDKPFKCSKCSKQFTQKEILRQHMNKEHTKNPVVERHACFLCDKEFCYASGLSRHLLVHAGRTFACGVCGKEFVDKSSLKRHINIHKVGK